MVQARIEEVGQSLLRSAHDRDTGALSLIGSRRRRKSSRTGDCYEEHFILREDRVLVLTDAAMVCLLAPGFAAIHAAAEEGRLDTAGAPEIPASEIRWAVLWKVGPKPQGSVWVPPKACLKVKQQRSPVLAIPCLHDCAPQKRKESIVVVVKVSPVC